jgi:hypothetical protein
MGSPGRTRRRCAGKIAQHLPTAPRPPPPISPGHRRRFCIKYNRRSKDSAEVPGTHLPGTSAEFLVFVNQELSAEFLVRRNQEPSQEGRPGGGSEPVTVPATPACGLAPCRVSESVSEWVAISQAATGRSSGRSSAFTEASRRDRGQQNLSRGGSAARRNTGGGVLDMGITAGALPRVSQSKRLAVRNAPMFRA